MAINIGEALTVRVHDLEVRELRRTTVEGIDALAALITCKSLIGLRASLSPYGDWQLMAVMVGRSHWRCARHAFNWLQQKVEHAA